MLKNSRLVLSALALVGLSAGTAQAALIDRGGGLIYDNVLNITWMQDALYSQTSGASPSNGRLTWQEAMDFAANTAYYDSVSGQTLDDWRLPTMFTVPAGSPVIYDTLGQLSELSYMYYVNLGYSSVTGHDPSLPAPTSSNYNPFINLTYRAYWTNTSATPRAGNAWILHAHFGSLETTGKGDGSRVWLVRDGDVARNYNAVPEPTTLGLLGLGLAGIGFARRKRKQA